MTDGTKQPIPFGRYVLLERVSIGGMAEIWRGRKTDGKDARVYAIKRILPSIAEDTDFLAMFIDEAKITVQLTHPNIAHVLELGNVQNSFYIAMEYIAGRDMRALFERCRAAKQPPPVPLVCSIMMQVADGLDYAHKRHDLQGRPMSVVHRDVSPQNVLLGLSGEVKLIDFGIAKAADKINRTQAGILKGKFSYMSSEQIQGKPLDGRSDIFSAGTCLHEMLTAHRLFLAENDYAVLERVSSAEIAPPSRTNPLVPPALDAIVLKALSRDIDQRYQTAGQLANDLRAFLESTGVPAGQEELKRYIQTMFPDEVERENIRSR